MARSPVVFGGLVMWPGVKGIGQVSWSFLTTSPNPGDQVALGGGILDPLMETILLAVSEAPLAINQNPNLKVTVEALLDDTNATAVVVSVSNRDTKRAAVWVPIVVKLKDAAGNVLASNTAGGNDESLTHFPSLPPGGTAYFVDDQFPPGLGATQATVALGGQLTPIDQPLPKITVSSIHTSDAGGGLTQFTGRVRNDSSIAQPLLIVQAIAVRDGTIVAAGTSVVRDLAPGADSSFLGFFIGDPTGADIQIFAPPTAA